MLVGGVVIGVVIAVDIGVVIAVVIGVGRKAVRHVVHGHRELEIHETKVVLVLGLAVAAVVPGDGGAVVLGAISGFPGLAGIGLGGGIGGIGGLSSADFLVCLGHSSLVRHDGLVGGVLGLAGAGGAVVDQASSG